MSRHLYCVACDRGITIPEYEEFNYTKEADGPYCDGCWHFILHIEALRDRVTDLENKAKASRWNPKRHSPYDAGAPRRHRGY